MKWIDLFKFLNERANDFKHLGEFDWQAEIEVYDDSYGGLFQSDLVEMYDCGKKKFYLKIDSGDN
jgi:hypothetical protein